MIQNKFSLVSVGIPFYNAEKYLAYAITSVLQQSYIYWELFLLDDGSTDQSLEIAKKFEKKDNRIKVLSDGKNLGLPTRLNELSNLVNGLYYVRMDADDIMHPDRIKDQITYLQKHPEIDLVGSGLIAIDNENKIIGLRGNLLKVKYSLNDIVNGQWSVHPTITGKTTWFQQNKYDPSLKRAQDYDLWVRTVEKSYFSKLEAPYLYYREASTPTWKKYYVASKHSLRIYWKNKNIIGWCNCLKYMIEKILKLGIYSFMALFGFTDKMIIRRSTKMDRLNTKTHQNIINTVLKNANRY